MAFPPTSYSKVIFCEIRADTDKTRYEISEAIEVRQAVSSAPPASPAVGFFGSG